MLLANIVAANPRSSIAANTKIKLMMNFVILLLAFKKTTGVKNVIRDMRNSMIPIK